jgi:hypothetical protein
VDVFIRVTWCHLVVCFNAFSAAHHFSAACHGCFALQILSSNRAALNWLSSGNHIMAAGRIASTNIRSVTIDANEPGVLINRLQFLRNVQTQSIFVMTFGARSNRHVRLETAQAGRLGNVDMTGGALGNVLLAPMSELH